MSADPAIVSVTGGAHGIAASHAEVRWLAEEFDRAGDRLRGLVPRLLTAATDADLVESGLLSPVTCAAAEHALFSAVTGSDGLLARALAWEVDAIATRGALAILEGADEAAGAASHALDVLLMHSAIAPTALAVAVGTTDPTMVEHVVGGLTTPGVRELLAAVYDPHGRAVVTSYDADLPGDRRRPGSVHDLVAHLQEVAALSPTRGSEGDGTVQVQTIRVPGEPVRHVVYLPGTDRFDTPWQDDDGERTVRDMATNVELMAGRSDDYTAGVATALARAGVGVDDPVLLVGHSQGGMAAAAILVGRAGFHVTDAVTAGSPTAQVGPMPQGAHVLSLEQRGDPVPLLDGAANPDSVQQTTVVFDAHPAEGVVAAHSYPTYLEGAALVDAATDPSVVAAVQGLTDRGFLGADLGAQVSTQTFAISRGP